MGTKNNPGQFDCYTNAGPDEPMFVLLARDPIAPLIVQHWIEMRKKYGLDTTNSAKLVEAQVCVFAMLDYAKDAGMTPLHELKRHLPSDSTRIRDWPEAEREVLRQRLAPDGSEGMRPVLWNRLMADQTPHYEEISLINLLVRLESQNAGVLSTV
jgi:hypothetical protein